MRRLSRRFRFQSRQQPEGDEFEMTLLRINPINTSRRTLAILCRRVEKDTAAYAGGMGMKEAVTLRCRVDESFTLIRLGDHIPMLAGYSPEELKTELQNQMIRMVHPEDREKVRHAIRSSLIHSTTGETECRVMHKDGRILWVRDIFYLRTDADGEE